MEPTNADDTAAAPKRYRLLPSLRAGQLADSCYLYDEAARTAPIVYVPTQKVPRRAHDVVRKLRQANPANEPWTLEAIRAVFDDPQDVSAIDVLLRRGYLEEHSPASAKARLEAELAATTPEGSPASLQETYAPMIREFQATESKHFFDRPRLFGVPADIEDRAAEVSFVGVPCSTVGESMGTLGTPGYLRAMSQRCGLWFDIYKDGVFTELGMDDTLPAVLCKEVMLKDHGDLGSEARTVADMFSEIRGFVRETILPNGIRPIFVGGDHAITFPIVDAFLADHPDLCLLHFDAHSDLFYCDQIVFHHAAPVSNLVVYSGLSQVYSFGLRNEFKSSMEGFSRLVGDERVRDRLHLYSIAALKRLLQDPARLEGLFDRIGGETPCYLSIDLDVLSADGIAGQLSTPCGAGLEWWELFEALTRVFLRLNVVACDVVEFNLARRTRSDDPERLPFLLMLLIDGLARARGREGKGTSP